jgi:uncharacterized protein (TIGR01777 family)
MKSRRIVIAGGSGFLGQTLAEYFGASGWDVFVLTRMANGRPRAAREVLWDGKHLDSWVEELDGADAVINLTGRTVNCRYGTKNRREIMDSRVNSTRVIGEAIATCAKPPRVWVNASTATIYKHTFEEPHGEGGEIGPTHEAQDAFSIEVARAWEKALLDAITPATRKVAMRAAMVLGKGKNSVFPMLRRLARTGLGGQMGTGEQFVSWIHERDFAKAVEWILDHEELVGPINVAAPNPVTNAEMMRIFREAVGAPFGLPAPQWMLKIGAFVLRTEVELMIKSRKVVPKRLLQSGFEFNFPTMKAAVTSL